jgi:hypothetical protein
MSHNGHKSILADALLQTYGQEQRDRVMSIIYSDEFAKTHGDFVSTVPKDAIALIESERKKDLADNATSHNLDGEHYDGDAHYSDDTITNELHDSRLTELLSKTTIPLDIVGQEPTIDWVKEHILKTSKELDLKAIQLSPESDGVKYIFQTEEEAIARVEGQRPDGTFGGAELPTGTVIKIKDSLFTVKNNPDESIEFIPVDSTPKTVNPTDFTNHSGGAIGADMMWDKIGRELGFLNHNHYWANSKTPGGNVQLTDAQLEEGIVHAKAAARVLGRPWNDKFANLLGRNWYQVKNSTQVVAVAPLIQPGEKNSKGYTSKAARTTVDGGTGYAVEMGIANGKEVVVFDTKTNQWYKWNGTTFELSEIPTLHKDFAGIGSRQDNGTMTPESIQAIRDVYEKTLKVGSSPVETSQEKTVQQLSLPAPAVSTNRKSLTDESVQAMKNLLEREFIAAAVHNPEEDFLVPWVNPRVEDYPDAHGFKPSEYAMMLDDWRMKMGEDFPQNLKFHPAFLMEMNNNPDRLIRVFSDKINSFNSSRLAWRIDEGEQAKWNAKMEICITDSTGKVEDYFAKKHGTEGQLGVTNMLNTMFFLMYNKANGTVSVPHLFGQLLKEAKKEALKDGEHKELWQDAVNAFAYTGGDPKLSFIDLIFENLGYLGYKIDIADKNKLKTYFNTKKTDNTFIKVDEGMSVNIEESQDYQKDLEEYISDNIDSIRFEVEDMRTEVVKGWQDSSFEKNNKDAATARLKIFMAGQSMMESFDFMGLTKSNVPFPPDAIDISDTDPETVKTSIVRGWNGKKLYHKDFTGQQLEEVLKGRFPRITQKTIFGIPTLVAFDQLYETVQGLLSDRPNLRFQEAMAVLRSQGNPNLDELASRLEGTTARNRAEFIKVMRMQYNKFYVLRADTKENSMKTRVIDAQRYKQEQVIVRGWQDAQLLSPIIKVRSTGERVIDVEQARHHVAVIHLMQQFDKINLSTPAGAALAHFKITEYLKTLAQSNPAARGFIGDIDVNKLVEEETSTGKKLKGEQRPIQKALLKKMFAAHGVDLADKVLDDMAGYSIKDGHRIDWVEGRLKDTDLNTSWLGQFTTTLEGKPVGMFSIFFNRAAGLSQGADIDESITDELENAVKENNPIYTESKTMGLLASFASKYSDKLYNSVHTTIEGKQNWDYSFPTALSNSVVNLKTDADGTRTHLLASVWGDNYYLDKLSNMHLGYLEGLNVDNTSFGKVRENMSDREQLLTSIGLFTNQGRATMNVMSLTHSDKTTTPIFYGLPKVKTLGKDGNLHKNIVDAFYTVFLGEWKRILKVQSLKKEQGTTGSESMDSGGENFFMFPSLNKSELKHNSLFLFDEDGTIKSNLDADAVSFVKEQIAKYLLHVGGEAYNYFKENDIDHTRIDEDYFKKEKNNVVGTTAKKNEEALKRTAVDYALNTLLWNSSASVLLMGDAVSAWKTNIEGTLAEFSKRLAKDIAPGQSMEFESPFYNQLTIADTTMTYAYATKFGSNVADSKATDAQEFTTTREHIEVMYKAGKIEEALYTDLLSTLKSGEDFSPIQLQQMLEPLGAVKPVYSGARYENYLVLYDYLKTSAFPLLAQYTRDTELDKLRLLMEGKLPGHESTNGEELYQRCTFKSGSKMGNGTSSASVFDENNIFTVPTKEALRQSSRVLNRANFRIQQEVPNDDTKTQISVVTQMDKLITEGILDMKGFTIDESGKTYTGTEVRKRKEQIRIAAATTKLKSLYNKLGVKNYTERIEPMKVIQLLLDAARAGEYAPNDIALLESVLTEVGPDGKPKDYMAYPIFFHTAVEKFEKLLLAQVKKVTEFKMPGKSYVQASSIGMRRLADISAADRKGIITVEGYDLDEPLNHMRIDEEGNVLPAQVIAPFNFHINGVKQSITDFLVPGTNKLDMSRVPKELLQLVGARIPNQGHNSMIPIEIVGFTPDWMGDLMIVPGAITGQMGSDFDVDKLFTYQRPYWHNPETDSFMQVQTGEKETEDTLQKDYFNIHWGVLTHREMYAKVFSALDKPDLGFEDGGANEIFKRESKGVHTYFSMVNQLKTFQSAKDAKALVGATSLSSTFESNLQNKTLRLGHYVPTKEGWVERFDSLRLDGLDLSHISGTALSKGLKSTSDYSTWYSKHDNITIDQSGAVDNAKDRTLDNLNITTATYPALAAMNMLHKPNDDSPNESVSKLFQTALMAQEIIWEYTREYRKGNDALTDEFDPSLKENTLRKLKEKYQARWEKATGLKVLKKDSIEPTEDGMKFLNSVAETEVDYKMLVSAFNSSLNENSKDALYCVRQLAALEKFGKLLEIGERLRHLQRTLNQDTNGAGPSLVYVLKQESNHEGLGRPSKAKIFLGEESLLDPESQLEAIYQKTIPVARGLLSSIFPVDAIEHVMSQVASISGKDMDDLPLKTQTEVLRQLRSFVISASPAVAMHSTEQRVRLLYSTETSKSLAQRVELLKRTNKTNALLNRISTSIETLSNGPDFLELHVEKSTRSTDNQIIKDFAALIQSSDPTEREIGEDLVTWARLITPQAGSQSLAAKVPAGIVLGTDVAVNLRAHYEFLNDRMIPPGFLPQLIQHVPSLAMQVKGSTVADTLPQYRIEGRYYPELVVFNYGKNPTLKVIPGENNEKKYTPFIQYFSKKESKTILYKLQSVGSLVTYQRIDVLKQGNIVQYDSSVQGVNRSLFAADRADTKPGAISPRQNLHEEVEGTIEKTSDPANAFSRWNLQDGGEAMLNQGLKQMSADPVVPAYLRLLASSLSDSGVRTVDIEARELLRYGQTPLTFELKEKLGRKGSYHPGTGLRVMTLGKTSNVQLAANTLIHETLHFKSTELLRALGWLPKEALWKATQLADTPMSRERFEALYEKELAKCAEFAKLHPELYKKALALDKLRLQAYEQYKAELLLDGVDVAKWESELGTGNLSGGKDHKVLYALSSLSEFVVHVLSDKDTMDFLNTVNSTAEESWFDKTIKSLMEFWDEVLKVLSGEYNEKSILKDAVSLSYGLTNIDPKSNLIRDGETVAPQTLTFNTEQEARHMQNYIETSFGKTTNLTDEGTFFNLVVGEDSPHVRTEYLDKVLENMYRQIQVLDNALARPIKTAEDRDRRDKAQLLYNEVKEDYEALKESNDLNKTVEIGKQQIKWVQDLLAKGNLHLSEVTVAWQVLDTWNSLSEVYKTNFDRADPEFKLATSNLEGLARELTNKMVGQGMHAAIESIKAGTPITLVPADFGINLKEMHASQEILIYLERDANRLSQAYTTFAQYHVQNAEAEKMDLTKDLKRFNELVSEKDYSKFIQENKEGTVYGLVQLLHPNWYQGITRYRGTLRHRLEELRAMPVGTAEQRRSKVKAAEQAYKNYWRDNNKNGIAIPIQKLLDLATGELRTDPEAQAVLDDLYSKTVREATDKVLDRAIEDYKKYLGERDIKFAEIDSEVDTNPSLLTFDPATLPAEDWIAFSALTPTEQLAFASSKTFEKVANEKARRKLSWEERNSPVKFMETEPSKSQKEQKIYEHNGRFKAWFVPKNMLENLDPKYHDISTDVKLKEAYDILTKLSQRFRDYLPPSVSESLHENFLPIISIDQMSAASGFLSNFGKTSIGQKILEQLSVTKAQIDRKSTSKIPVKYTGQAPRDADNKIDLTGISQDLPRLFEMFGTMAIHFHHMYPVNEVANVLTRLVQEENNDRLKQGKKGLNNLLEMMQYYQDMLVYQKPTELQGVGTTPIYSANIRENMRLTREVAKLNKDIPDLNSRILDEYEETGNNPEDTPSHPLVVQRNAAVKRLDELRESARYLAGSKVADAAIGIQQLKSMSYNPFSAVSNLTYGYLSAMLHARGFRAGQDGYTTGDFTVEQLKTAFKMMKGNVARSWLKASGYEGDSLSRKVEAIIRRTGSIEALIDVQYGKTNLVENQSNTRKFLDPYAAQKSGDFLTKGACIIARTLNVPVKVQVEGEEKTIPLFEALNEAGEWDSEKYGENKDWSSPDSREEQKEWNKFTFRVRKTQVVVFGAQDKHMPQYGKKDMFGRLIGQFKFSWIPEGIKTRWGSDQGYDETLERNVEGRYRTMGRMQWAGIPMLLNQIASVVSNNNPFEGAEIWRVVDGERQLVPMQEYEKENMRRNLAGLSYTAFILSAYFLLKAALPDAEELKRRRRLGKDNTKIQRMTINMLYRTYQDLAIYSSPDVFDQLTGNPVPSWSVVRDALAVPKAWFKFLTDEGYHIDKPVLKTTKALPFLNNANKLKLYTTGDLSGAVR